MTVTNSFGATQMTITDMNGKLVFERALSKETENVTLPAIAAGTYMVELKSSTGEQAVKKIVIQ